MKVLMDRTQGLVFDPEITTPPDLLVEYIHPIYGVGILGTKTP